jgi:hypothetical protein
MMNQAPRKSSKPSPIMLRLEMRERRGCFVAADPYAAKKIKEKGFRIGDLIAVTMKKLNSIGLNKLLHYIGLLCVQNLDSFSGLDAHTALKRLQIEGNIECDEIGVPVELALKLLRDAVERGDKMVMWRIPRSMSFETMDEGERHEMGIAFCRHISKHYWPDLSPEQIEAMAEGMNKITD